MWGREPFEKGPSPPPPPAKTLTGGVVTRKEFRCIEAKRKLPLHENSFVKATAPFLLFAEIKTILQRIAVIVPGHPGSCIC